MIKIGSKVRIKKDALDERSIQRSSHLPEYEVVAIVGEEWVRVANPSGKGTSSLWPVRMLETS